jgi:hypothetical protein
MKQVTLEEEAKNCLKENRLPIKGDFAEGYIVGAIFGSEWQQERMYSEEDMREAIFTSFLLGVDRGNYSKELEDDLLKQYKKK